MKSTQTLTLTKRLERLTSALPGFIITSGGHYYSDNPTAYLELKLSALLWLCQLTASCRQKNILNIFTHPPNHIHKFDYFMQISAAFIYIQHDLSTQNAAAEMQTSLKLKFNWTAELRK